MLEILESTELNYSSITKIQPSFEVGADGCSLRMRTVRYQSTVKAAGLIFSIGTVTRSRLRPFGVRPVVAQFYILNAWKDPNWPGEGKLNLDRKKRFC